MVFDIRDIFQSAYLTYYANGTTKMENDGMGRAIYIGYAEAGTAVTSPKWQIRLITYDSNGAVTDIQFASGSAEFKFTWSLRGGYVYS
jgi:uncharacterized protein RhaS with RHS repeats